MGARLGDPDSAGGCLAPVRGCPRKVWIQISIPWMCVCTAAGTCARSSVKEKIKVGLSGNLKIENKKPGVRLSRDLLVPADLRTSCALGKANGLEVICGKYPSASGVLCQPGVSSAPEMQLPMSLNQDSHPWPRELDPHGLCLEQSGVPSPVPLWGGHSLSSSCQALCYPAPPSLGKGKLWHSGCSGAPVCSEDGWGGGCGTAAPPLCPRGIP